MRRHDTVRTHCYSALARELVTSMNIDLEPSLGNKSSGVFSSEHSRPTSSMSLSTNNDGSLPLTELRRLSVGTAATTPLPASSPVDSHVETFQNYGPSSPSTFNQPRSNSLRRTPSSSSLGRNEQPTTPTLRKRVSMSSLNGASSVTPPRPPAFRRMSSNQSVLLNSDMRPRSGLSAPPEEPVAHPITASSVAQNYFQSELEAHHGSNETQAYSETVVILHDSCYGHRFSRPRTSKAGLNTIVERPERIHASIMGLATAYVWLGGRHAKGTAAPYPNPDMNEIPSVPFRIHRTTRSLSLNSPAATAVHGAKWMDELRIMCDSAETKLALNGKELIRPPTGRTAGSNSNSDAAPRKLHEGDLYLCSGSLSALEGALGGVCEGVDAVFAENSTKRAFVCIRPPGHHCSADYPSGFCWLNNVHVGIGHASLTHGLTHAAIIDFDLHHGDGSQAIAWEHNSRVASLPKNSRSKKTAIGYFSLHDINSYPCEMGDEEKVRNASLCLENAHGQSIWNVHLQPWKSETEFWNLYEDRYSIILSKARSFLKSTTERLRSSPHLPTPKGAIFLSAGFDASEWESPGMQRHQVNVPTDFYARFTRDVVALANEEGLGVDGRVISVLEGGYSDRALMSGVLSHLCGLTASPVPQQEDIKNGLGQEMSLRLGKLSLDTGKSHGIASLQPESTETYDPRWWALAKLEEIENILKPQAPLPASRKPRNANPPTYTSSTQSSTAKIVSNPSARRSLSGSTANNSALPLLNSRPPSPPPPAVDWATAAHELSKLLIPSDRQTRSCRPEELNAEASRARKDRHSVVGLPTGLPTDMPTDMPAPEGRMQLRDRRTRPPPKYVSDDEDRPVSRSSRRKTVANPVSLNQELQSLPPVPSQSAFQTESRQAPRRLSVASSIGSLNNERSPGLSAIANLKDAPKRDQITVRKIRVPSNTSTEVKSRAVRKQPLGPRIPSSSAVTSEPEKSSTAKSSTIMSPIVTSSFPAEDRVTSAVNKDLKSCDVDLLASGMKKMSIKLNLPSKEEQEAREAKLKPPIRGRPKSAVTKTRNPRELKKVKQVDKSISATGALEASEEPLSQDVQGELSKTEPTKLAANTAQILFQGSAPVEDNNSLHPQASPSSNESMVVDSSVPDEPQIPSVPSFLGPGAAPILAYDSTLTNYDAPILNPSLVRSPLDDPHTYETPASIQSTPIRQRQDLPIFTSTSPINFATVLNPSIGQAIAAEASNENTPVNHTLLQDTHPRTDQIPTTAKASSQLTMPGSTESAQTYE